MPQLLEKKTDEIQDLSLQNSRTTLSDPSQMSLKILRNFQANLRHNRDTQDDVFVIKGLRQPLVGRLSLNLLIRVEPVIKTLGMSQETVMKQFPKLFRGLATLKGTYQIKLILDTLPFILTTPH